MQITDTPLAIVVGVNKQNLTHDMIMKTKEFNISVLTQNTPFDVFKHFGYQSGKTIDKFRDYKDKIEGENGIFYLSKYSNSYLYCKVMEVFEFGTHSLFKAEVIDAHLINNDETVTYTYYQTYIKPKPIQETQKGWRCNICGYIYEGEDLPSDFICPICKHGAKDFSKI